MTQLWECFSLGITHRKEKSAQLNWWMMWRRTADGLASEQQQQLFHAAQLVWAKPGQRWIYQLAWELFMGDVAGTLSEIF
jgi:hypothetical protein